MSQYTVAEASQQLGIARSTIYRKLAGLKQSDPKKWQAIFVAQEKGSSLLTKAGLAWLAENQTAAHQKTEKAGTTSPSLTSQLEQAQKELADVKEELEQTKFQLAVFKQEFKFQEEEDAAKSQEQAEKQPKSAKKKKNAAKSKTAKKKKAAKKTKKKK